MLRQSELEFFYQNGTSHIFPDYFEAYKNYIPENERDDLVKAYHSRLTSTDKSVQLEAARHWSKWEMATSKLNVTKAMLDRADDDEFALAFARVSDDFDQG
jgi:proline iminopeptidase